MNAILVVDNFRLAMTEEQVEPLPRVLPCIPKPAVLSPSYTYTHKHKHIHM